MAAVAKTDNPLADYVAALVREYGTQEAVAKALGVTSGSFFRQVRNGTVGLEPLLKIARLRGEHPRRILELARKQDWADLLESVYGCPAEPISAADRELMNLPQQYKRSMLEGARALVATSDRASPADKRPAKAKPGAA